MVVIKKWSRLKPKRGDNIKPLLDYEENLEKLKVEDIVNVAKKYLIKENSTTLILKEKN